MKNKVLYFILFMLCANVTAVARDPFVQEYYNKKAQNGESDFLYQTLYSAYTDYLNVLSDKSSEPEDRQTAVAGLAEMYPCMLNGVVFYTNANRQDNALKFAEAYIDLSLNDHLKPYNLPIAKNYPQIAYFAASNNYNTKNWEKAVKYLDAYIRSGDTQYVKDAFNFAAKAANNLGQKAYAQQIVKTGLGLFPDDLALLSTAINIFAELKNDDTALQTYVTKASLQRPNDEGLLNIQAQLYERMQNYESAIVFYQILQEKKPQNLEITRHLALNYYNAGVLSYNDGIENPAQAKEYFQHAAKLLNDVLVSDPLAVNYTYALANAYSALGDQTNLNQINDRLIALGCAPVAADATPGFVGSNNNAIASLNNNQGLSNQGLPSFANNVPTNPANDRSNLGAGNGQYQPLADNNQRPNLAELDKKVSDVDIDIPQAEKINDNTYVVIIANEKYQKVKGVDNAENDGRVFAQYCKKTLGIGDRRIKTYYNAGFVDTHDALDWLENISNARKGDMNVIFYYSGHGIPDERTKTGYILPIESDGKNMKTCISLKNLYNRLSNLNTRNTLVFMDACFSGSTKSEDMLFAARGVAIPVNEDELDGNLIVFSAATADQTAWGYDEQGHGMFTYFLLKKLQETGGDVTLGALVDYVCDRVSIESLEVNNKPQTPTVNIGSGVDEVEWKSKVLGELN